MSWGDSGQWERAVDSFTKIFDRLDRELWIVTAGDAEQRSGLVATYVSSVSLVPDLPRVTIALAKHHYTHALIEASGAFCMHLVDESQIDWVWRFGILSGRDLNKFEGLSTSTGAGGAPILANALGWVDCRVESRLDTGDRTIFLAQALDAGCGKEGAGRKALTFRRLLELAPPERLRELKAAMERDIELDRGAILEWRNRDPR